MLQIPETPLWYLSKNRTDEAEKALCWLRGWVSRQTIASEFQSLQRYSARSASCDLCIKQNLKCSHPSPNLCSKMGDLKQRQTFRPFLIVMALFFISSFGGIVAMTPFSVQIFRAYQSPIAPDKMAAAMSFATALGNVGFLCLLRFTGKRRLYLTTLSGMLLSAIVVCIYGWIYLPSGYNSFDKLPEFSLPNESLSYIPLVFILTWSFLAYCGVSSLPWQLVSEVYPYK